MEDGVKIGPLIDEDGYDKVMKHIEDAVEKGGKVTTYSGNGDRESGGYFVEPTIITDVTDDMICMSEETFGLWRRFKEAFRI